MQGKGATMRESVNGLFLTTTGQQLLVLWACSAGCSPAVWSQPGRGVGGMREAPGAAEKPSQTSLQTPLPPF